jgi:hypothetical protein
MRPITDFELQGIQIKNRIHFLERPILLGFDLVDDFIGDNGNQARETSTWVDLFQMLLNLTSRSPSGLKGVLASKLLA